MDSTYQIDEYLRVAERASPCNFASSGQLPAQKRRSRAGTHRRRRPQSARGRAARAPPRPSPARSAGSAAAPSSPARSAGRRAPPGARAGSSTTPRARSAPARRRRGTRPPRGRAPRTSSRARETAAGARGGAGCAGRASGWTWWWKRVRGRAAGRFRRGVRSAWFPPSALSFASRPKVALGSSGSHVRPHGFRAPCPDDVKAGQHEKVNAGSSLTREPTLERYITAPLARS